MQKVKTYKDFSDEPKAISSSNFYRKLDSYLLKLIWIQIEQRIHICVELAPLRLRGTYLALSFQSRITFKRKKF